MSTLYLSGDGTIVTGTVTVNPGSIADEATLDVDVTITGIETGDVLIALQPSADLIADLQQVGIWISAADTATVRLANDSGGALDEPETTWKFAYIKTNS